MERKVKFSDFILPAYREFWKSCKDPDVLLEVLKGGRNSGKSFAVPIVLLKDIIKYPISVLCIRKVENTQKGEVLYRHLPFKMLVNFWYIYILTY